MLRVGFTYDLRRDYLAMGFSPEETAEFDEDVTIDSIAETLAGLGLRVDRIGNGRALAARLVAGDRWDIVFNITEGLRGRSREAQVPALLEMFDVPYAFSDPLTCAVTLDKAVTKELVRAAGLNTPDHAVVRGMEEVDAIAIPFPLFVKPLSEGTGKGVDRLSRVEDRAALADRCRALLELFAQPVLVEAYLPGREFTTGIVGTGPEARVVGTMELVIAAGAGDYGHHVKDNWRDLVAYRAMEAGTLRDEAEELALAAHRALDCRDGSRVDLRVDARGRPAFIEVNPLPGLNPVHSDLPMLARMHGMDFSALIGAIVDSALSRHGLARG